MIVRIKLNHILFFFIFLFFACSFKKQFYYDNGEYIKFKDSLFATIELKNDKGKLIAGIESKVKNPKATILLLHGNEGNISNWSYFALPFINAGYHVILFDYQGYGKSTGKANHKNVVSDTELYLNYAFQNKGSEPLILWGFSIGGNLAVHIAQRNSEIIDYLVLEGAATSHTDIATFSVPHIIKPATRILVKSPYKSKNIISELELPMLIIHSKEDEIAPYGMGKLLYQNSNGNATFWTIDGKHCHGILDYQNEYISKINELINQK